MDEYALGIATSLISIFRENQNETRGEVEERLADYEADATDYRTVRGLAHVIESGFCEYETVSPLDPPLLREGFSLFRRSTSRPTWSKASAQLSASPMTLAVNSGAMSYGWMSCADSMPT
jgi:predicted nuclease of restriction endonuclease-like RecB superfamily